MEKEQNNISTTSDYNYRTVTAEIGIACNDNTWFSVTCHNFTIPSFVDTDDGNFARIVFDHIMTNPSFSSINKFNITGFFLINWEIV